MTMFAPLLSLSDPAESSEGALDPLGLYPIADNLALKLIPGVRERQVHPRFLTLSAVSLAICQEFVDDAVAADETSEPYMVFEWHVVEGLVRQYPDIKGLAGRDKVSDAIKAKIPVSTKSYLKNASVFGFHGIYRYLAETTGISVKNRLGSTGFELLDVWRKEQGMKGFAETGEGPGKKFYASLNDAVKDGLEKGYAVRNPGWNCWELIAEHLYPFEIPRNERKALIKILMADEEGHRHTVLNFLTSPKGIRISDKISEKYQDDEIWCEEPFHSALYKEANRDLKVLLKAIMQYEEFSRVLYNAFLESIGEMSNSSHKTKAVDLAKSNDMRKAARIIPALFRKTSKALADTDQANKFYEGFSVFVDACSANNFAVRLLEHHKKIQRNKPPNGKQPWLNYFDDGSYMIRPDYAKKAEGVQKEGYVHAYRLSSLQSFARDLRMGS